MNITKAAILCLAFTANAAFAQGKEAKNPDAQAIDTACSTDSATAGCGGEKVGTGLLKCLWAYKKAHKDYNFSGSCKAAMEKARSDRKK